MEQEDLRIWLKRFDDLLGFFLTIVRVYPVLPVLFPGFYDIKKIITNKKASLKMKKRVL